MERAARDFHRKQADIVISRMSRSAPPTYSENSVKLTGSAAAPGSAQARREAFGLWAEASSAW